MDSTAPDFDLDDARLRGSGTVKWTMPAPDVLPAWVAELDVAPCPPVREALHRAIDGGNLGYPALDGDTDLPQATADFVADRFGWAIDPGNVISVGDVMSGALLALRTVCAPGPIVVPVPAYTPFLMGVPWIGRELVTVPMLEPTAEHGWALDLERIGAALAAGARTVLLANPHNPTGRCFSRPELEALRDVVLRYGARVISDEIHAPLTLPGATHTPYAVLDGTNDHVISLVSASKAWNLAGLKCAQLIPGAAQDAAIFRALPSIANHGTSPLGVVASIAAYRRGGPWLDGLIDHLAGRRAQLGALLAEHLPRVSWRPSEATYLTWLDVRDLGLNDPAATALADARVMVNSGAMFGADPGFIRLNLGTSAERLERIVRALAPAWN